MPSFPHPGSVTVCEINRDLITAENLSDDLAIQTYAKILGTVFSPIRYEPENLLVPAASTEEPQRKVGLFSAALSALSTGSLRPLLQHADVKLLQDVDLHGLSWHQHKHMLAFISGLHHVTIRDYEDSAEEKDPCILLNERQKDVKVLEWRPNAGKTLAVACKGGICIWSACYPGNMPCVRSGVNFGTLSRGSGTRWTLIDFLQSPDDDTISALTWSPDGRYLASASFENSSFTVWDVAQARCVFSNFWILKKPNNEFLLEIHDTSGMGTPIRRGLGGISLLKWSPSGDYFFASKFDGTFYLWETNTWTSEMWSSTSGFVTGATWDPDGLMILLGFSKSSTLGSIHFASKPPSLDAHLVPVELPELKTLPGCSEGIEKIAWNASGERLAISYRDGDELYKGLIAIYDIKRTPFISASLVGFIRGPGENPKPLAFSFHDKFKQGPLLSVCWSSGFCCTYPLIFRSHVVP